MFQKFYELFNALNTEALKHSEKDLFLIEEAQKELMNAWTDYMMSRAIAPTDEEQLIYYECLQIVERF